MITRRVLLWIAVGTLLYTGLQCLPGLFHAWKFDDFVKDEVHFAPVRENREQTHLVEHIIQGARDCHVEVDPHTIEIVKSRDIKRDVNTLTVDVAYEVPIHILGWTRNLDRRVEGSATY